MIGGGWEAADSFNRSVHHEDGDDGRHLGRFGSMSRRSSVKSNKNGMRKLLIDVRDALQELSPVEREQRQGEERKGQRGKGVEQKIGEDSKDQSEIPREEEFR